MEYDINELVRVTWDLHKVNDIHHDWYIKYCGTFCSLCGLAYDFHDSYKALLLSRAKGQMRGPRCIKCGKILRTRPRSTRDGGFWKKVDKIEGR